VSKLADRFADLRARDETALVPFVTAGDPDLETTEALVGALALAGADVIELGVPFSDPMADGPTIQPPTSRITEPLVRMARRKVFPSLLGTTRPMKPTTWGI